MSAPAPVEGQRTGGLSNNTRGALFALAAALVISAFSVLTKDLGQRYNPVQVVWTSLFVGLFLWVPMARLRGAPILPRARWSLHIGRSVAGFSSFCLFMVAITHLPLANAVSISFALPLVLVVFAVLFLGEKVRWRRWTATIVGFIGVIVAMRPGQSGFDPIYLASIASVILGASAVTMMKRLTRTEHILTLITVFGWMGAIVGAPIALWTWVTPTADDLPLFVAAATLSATGQILFLASYHYGDTTVVAPIDYTRIIFSGFFAYLMFREVPDSWTVSGALIIAGSTLYITLREAWLSRTTK